MTERPEHTDAELDALLSRAADRIVTPPHLLDAVEQRVESQRPGMRTRPLRINALLALAAAVALLIAGWLVLSGGPGASVGRPDAAPQVAKRPQTAEQNAAPVEQVAIDTPRNQPDQRVQLATPIATRIGFPDESNLFARHIESTSSDVSIYFIYHSAGALVAESGDDTVPATPRSDDT